MDCIDGDSYRIEKDTLGEVKIPRDAYWGAQTQRAYNVFKISGYRFPREFIWALGLLKYLSAEVNLELGLLEPRVAEAIKEAAREVYEGKLDDQFVLDIFQTGSGTSTNMNANEVIANRANEILGYKIGEKFPVHPNDHVNRCQSSNDVIPTAIHIATVKLLREKLYPSMDGLISVFKKKANEFRKIVKTGRTHLQDATPVTLGQEFSGYGDMIAKARKSIDEAERFLHELALGGTAVGTGINAHPNFAKKVIEKLREITGTGYREAENHFRAQGSMEPLVCMSGALKMLASSLYKIANDIRILSSGPRCGIAEIVLPTVQPGSSIMPGKINPVIPEAVCQVAVRVLGNDFVVSIGSASGNLELNTMMPVMAHSIFESINLLANSMIIFADRCITGIRANNDRINECLQKNLSLCTVLAPVLGYDKAAEIAKKAYLENKTIKEVVLEMGLMNREEVDVILDPGKIAGL